MLWIWNIVETGFQTSLMLLALFYSGLTGREEKMDFYNHQPHDSKKEKKKYWQLRVCVCVCEHENESNGGRGRGRHLSLQLINRTLFRLACNHYLFTGVFSQAWGKYVPASQKGGGGWTPARCRLLPWRSIRWLHCRWAGSSEPECWWEGVSTAEKNPKVALRRRPRRLQECIDSDLLSWRVIGRDVWLSDALKAAQTRLRESSQRDTHFLEKEAVSSNLKAHIQTITTYSSIHVVIINLFSVFMKRI